MAVADYAEGLTSRPPNSLYLAQLNQQYGGLPAAGGHLDQSAILLLQMSVALDVFQAVQSYRHRTKTETAKWFNENRYWGKLVDMIGRWRLQQTQIVK